MKCPPHVSVSRVQDPYLFQKNTTLTTLTKGRSITQSLLYMCCCFLIHITLASSSSTIFDIRSYGAIPDGVTLNTAAIARTLQAASVVTSPTSPSIVLAQGNSTSTSIYLSGQIELPSNIILQISDATLLASANVSDYPKDESKWAFLFALNATNISVVGNGIVDGNQPAYINGWSDQNDEFIPKGWNNGTCTGECRPRNIRFRTCSNVLIEGILNTHSPDWTTHLENCTNVLIDNFQQYGDNRWPNNDGIDIDSSQNVVVRNSVFDTADDGVCIKSTVGLGVVDNIHVYNVTIRSRSAAIKFGSNTDTNCSNLLFENITIYDSNRGLGIQQRSQGNITNTTFRNIHVETRYQPKNWWGSAEPIYISSMPRGGGAPGVGLISNITFENIVARSENSAFLSGLSPGQVLQGVSLINVNITIDKWSNYSTPAHSYVPTSAIPSSYITPPLIKVDGLYIESAQDVLLDNVNIAFIKRDSQPYWSFVCVNTTNNQDYPVNVIGGSCRFVK